MIKKMILDNTYFIEHDSEKNINKIAVKLAIDENGNIPDWVEVVREGSWDDDWKGEFRYTEETLNLFKENFDKNILRYADGEIPFNYRHDMGGKASGWIEKMEIRPKIMMSGESVKSFWVKTAWTPNAKKEIAEREWKYYSIEDVAEYTDPETQEIHYHVLVGVALTNVPFISELEPAVRMNSKNNKKKEDYNMGLEEQVKTLSNEKTELAVEVKTLSTKNESLEESVTKLTSDMEAMKLAQTEKDALIEKETEVVDIITTAATTGKKLKPSILDATKESKEYKIGMESIDALKLAIDLLPELDINTLSRPQPIEMKKDDGKKDLSQGEFIAKVKERAAKKVEADKDLNSNVAYKLSNEELLSEGYTYTY